MAPIPNTQQQGAPRPAADHGDDRRLAGKSAVVTGASRGIGAEIALELARQGANVAVVYQQSEAAARRTVDSMAGHGGVFFAVHGDVTSRSDAESVVNAAAAAFGQVDILVNCAGIMRRASFLTLSDTEWRELIDVNLTGYFIFGQVAARHMVGRGFGAIVNVSSTNEEIAVKGCTGYAVTKGGVRQLTRQMALELAEFGIRANAVAPGMVETDLNREQLGSSRFRLDALRRIPLGRFADKRDVAKSVAFLASDDARSITGVTLLVDGGRIIG